MGFSGLRAFGYVDLDLPMSSIEELFRRMAFNVLARNQDDHVKNIAFLMDRAGRWAGRSKTECGMHTAL